jgi:hypothetical protein
MAIAVAAPLALPAAAASAASYTCNRFTSGGVTFSVCIEKVSAESVKAKIGSITGTYVSGYLTLMQGSSQAKSGCSGQWRPGSSCVSSYTRGPVRAGKLVGPV